MQNEGPKHVCLCLDTKKLMCPGECVTATVSLLGIGERDLEANRDSMDVATNDKILLLTGCTNS
jgi:hypothetical protein